MGAFPFDNRPGVDDTTGGLAGLGGRGGERMWWGVRLHGAGPPGPNCWHPTRAAPCPDAIPVCLLPLARRLPAPHAAAELQVLTQEMTTAWRESKFVRPYISQVRRLGMVILGPTPHAMPHPLPSSPRRTPSCRRGVTPSPSCPSLLFSLHTPACLTPSPSSSLPPPPACSCLRSAGTCWTGPCTPTRSSASGSRESRHTLGCRGARRRGPGGGVRICHHCGPTCPLAAGLCGPTPSPPAPRHSRLGPPQGLGAQSPPAQPGVFQPPSLPGPPTTEPAGGGRGGRAQPHANPTHSPPLHLPLPPPFPPQAPRPRVPCCLGAAGAGAGRRHLPAAGAGAGPQSDPGEEQQGLRAGQAGRQEG